MSLLPEIMTIIKLEFNFRHISHFRFVHNFAISNPYQYSIKNLRLSFEAGTNFLRGHTLIMYAKKSEKFTLSPSEYAVEQ